MPAPTALLRRPEELAEAQVPEEITEPQDEAMIAVDVQEQHESEPANPAAEDADFRLDEEGRPVFAPAKAQDGPFQAESRKVPIPPHRMTPLKKAWPEIYPPLVEHLKLQVRMNTKSRAVELRNSKHTADTGALQKGEDFVKAFTLGFEVRDAVALLRLDDLYIETFEIKDVKTLQGDHAGRAIGRIAGRDGKTKS
jgi:RNA-binding protein PNO1